MFNIQISTVIYNCKDCIYRNKRSPNPYIKKQGNLLQGKALLALTNLKNLLKDPRENRVSKYCCMLLKAK